MTNPSVCRRTSWVLNDLITLGACCNCMILGLGSTWKGGDVTKTMGGGQKVNLLHEALSHGDIADDQLILFVDSYDVIFLRNKQALLESYRKLGAKVLFAAEAFCWPNESLESSYPATDPKEKRFLNSGGLVGPASYLRQITEHGSIKDDGDDQLYYTEIFLDSKLREKYDIKLDTRSEIFQNLNGAMSELEFREGEDTNYLYNSATGTTPIILHGNGPIKHKFNSLTNYLSHTWTSARGCQHCHENNIDVDRPETHPPIVMAIFVDHPTPFMDVFFERIANLTYPKSKIHMSIYLLPSAVNESRFVEDFNKTHGTKYASSNWNVADDENEVVRVRKHAFALCLSVKDCQFVFALSPSVQLTAVNAIEHLVASNRTCLTPMMTRRGLLWSNFWGDLADDGYYARSTDYLDIIERRITGIWNVPFVRDIYMLSRHAVGELLDMPDEVDDSFEMTFAQTMRKKNLFMMVDNREKFGYLVKSEQRNTTHLHNDLWEFFQNPEDWEEQYIHPEYFKYNNENLTMTDFPQPCPDVFWVPLLTPKFCKQIIEEMEHYGSWSDGSAYDSRLEGGYENVPTRDIHMRQVEWEAHWIGFLRRYIYPLQRTLYQGHDDYPWARMNFIVRYRPDEQPSLRPHHDASSYTLNIALNEPGKDYEGGGTRFNRYNCSLTKNRVGWGAMFPGRVTHQHEGLTTTAGTRYIFVTFVNP